MDFAQNVASNVVAALVVAALAACVGYFTFSRLKANWRMLRYARRMKRGGVTNFFCTRQEFTTLRQGRTISEYLLLARKELIYVGFYLSGATDRAKIDDVVSALLQRGCVIELVFLDPDLDDNVLHCVERLLGIATGTMRVMLRHAIGHFQTFAAGLSTQDRERFTIRVHREILASSAFLIDFDEVDGRVLIDTKIHAAGRDFSYAMEFTRTAPLPPLAGEFGKSFKKIALGSVLMPLP